MNRIRRPSLRLCGLACVARLCLCAAAPLLVYADWPQWRCDGNRSASTPESGPVDPKLLWTIDQGIPDPAYDHQYRMCADETYAPVAADGLLFMPSNTTDQVTAFDMRTGALRWRVIVGGPVRFAPVYYEDKVIFASDDGYIYCVKATSGEQLWRTRGVPEELPDSWMLVNGRLCSRWPARGGPVEYDGVIYFGAGLWPEEGVYVTAVDAKSGDVLWRSDATSFIANGMSDHGRAYNLGLPPHGYAAVIDGRLAMPSGRSLAAWFDLGSGQMEPYTCFYVKTNPPRGTWSVQGVGTYSVQGGNWFATRAEAAPDVPPELGDAVSPLFWTQQTQEHEQWVVKHRPYLRGDVYNVHNENLYAEPVLADGVAYVSEFATEQQYLVPRGNTHVQQRDYDRITARDLTAPQWTTVKQRHYAHGKATVDATRLEFPVLWEMETSLKALIRAGDSLYAGGKNRVAEIRIPKQGETPEIVWEANVKGTPINALVSNGVLVVVTDEGVTYGFGEKRDDSPARRHDFSFRWSDSTADMSGGYRLALGTNGLGRLAGLTDRDSASARLIVLETDPTKVHAIRMALAEQGLYGGGIQIVRYQPGKTRLAPYWADSAYAWGAAESFFQTPGQISEIMETLRPGTGRFHLEQKEVVDAVDRWTKARPDFRRDENTKGMSAFLRHLPPLNSRDWTHESGSPGEQFSSGDQTVRWPLGVLWYSGEIDRHYTPKTHYQHERNPHPLFVDGRMFIITGRTLHAIDAYTGQYLWGAELPLTPWVKTWFFDSRAEGRPTDRSYAATADAVYVVTGAEIHVFHAITGEKLRVITMPRDLREAAANSPSAPVVMPYAGKGTPIGWPREALEIQTAPDWTQLRIVGDMLYAIVGDRLVAVNRHTGAMAWSRKSSRNMTSFAIGEDERIYGLDYHYLASLEVRRGGKPDEGGRLFALDRRSGDMIWERDIEGELGAAALVDAAKPWLAPSAPKVAINDEHDLVLLIVNENEVRALSKNDGAIVWEKRIQQVGRNGRHLVVGKDRLMISDYGGCYGYLFDVATGKELGDDTGIPRPRTCGRILGNDHLLSYRDAATELYDVDNNRMVEFNSVRAGCTTSFFPAGGIMNAPMMGHGCVCNYPMFASLALAPMPWMDDVRPRRVVDSWENELQTSGNLLGAGAHSEMAKLMSRDPIDLTPYRAVNSKIESSPGGLVVRTSPDEPGFAIRSLETPRANFTQSFYIVKVPEEGRHGNATFVLGSGEHPEARIECRFYYGGRSAIILAGAAIEDVEIPWTAVRSNIPVHVMVDQQEKSLVVKVGGQVVKTKFLGPIVPVTYYGYGGTNATNLFLPFDPGGL